MLFLALAGKSALERVQRVLYPLQVMAWLSAERSESLMGLGRVVAGS